MHWESSLNRLPMTGARRRKSRKTKLRVESLERREVPHVNGTVFIDFNLNGVQDAEDTGVAGVTVNATDDAGATASVTTDDSGSYELATDSDNVRIEFAGIPPRALPGRVAGDSGATVRFLNANSDRDGVNLGLASPMVVTTQFYYDRALDGMNSDQPAVLAVPYGDENPTPVTLANYSDVGSVWGVAYQANSNSVYVSSFVKRHAGLGPSATENGTTTGGIYRIDRSTDPATVSLLIDLNTAGGSYATGGDPHATKSEWDEGDWYHDNATVPLVGKRGLGGMAMSEDGRTLFVVNLYTRELIEVPLTVTGQRDSSRSMRRTPVPLGNPSGSGIPNFQSSDVRPFAVVVKGNAVFVGETYTAETGNQSAKDLRAFVYAFDPAQGAFRSFNQTTGVFAKSGSPTPVLIANLNYARGIADDPDPSEPGDEVSADWMRWTSKFDISVGTEGFPVHPQPWLTSIAFDGSAMVLGLRDRFGDQGGFQTGNGSSDEDSFSVIAVGDMLRASANSNGGWQLESGGAAGGVTSVGAGDGRGPGGGEFYVGNRPDQFPQKTGMGAVAEYPALQTVASTGIDPVNSFGGGIYTFFNSNAGNSGSAGSVSTRTELYSSYSSDTFGSSNGLGGLAIIAPASTVQVGDRVFVDKNKNGVQDPGENGLAGLVLKLFQGSTQVASTTSDSEGRYQFNDLLPNTPYQVRIDLSQSPVGGRSLAPATSSANPALDSSAVPSGSIANISFTTSAGGTTDTSLDVGFLPNTTDTSTSPPGDDSGGGSGTPTDPGTPQPGDGGSGDPTTPPTDGGTTDPGTTPSDPGTGNPGTTDPGTGTPGTTDPGTGTPGTTDPGTGTPGTTDPGTGTPGTTDPGSGTPGTTDPGTGSPGTTDPGTGSGGTTDPGTGTPGTTDPGTTPPTSGTPGDSGSTPPDNGNSNPDPGTPGTGGSTPGDGTSNPGSGGQNPGGPPPSDDTNGPTQQEPTPTPGLASVGGRVFLDFNNSGKFNGPDVGVQGVTMMLSGGSLASPRIIRTSAQGEFNFFNLPAGTYSVTEAFPTTPANLPGKVHAGTAGGKVVGQNSITKIVLKAGQSATGYRYALIPYVSTGGAVYEDTDNNGVRDVGEPGIAGVTVTLSGSSIITGKIAAQTATTDANGNYSFANLTPGIYKITEAPPAGYLDGKNENGTPAGAVSKHRFADINLTKSATSGGFNFGKLKPSSIAGTVFDDVNSDGDPTGEGAVGIANVKIRLAGRNDLGRQIDIFMRTGINGEFSFNGLRPGTYRLVESQPAGYDNGDNGEGDSGGDTQVVNDQIRDIQLDEDASATGYIFGEHSKPIVIVSQSPANVEVAPGGKVTITYKVRNKGTADAPDVTATMNFGGLQFLSASSEDFDSQTRIWSVGDLAAGEAKTIQITYRASHAGMYGPSVKARMTSAASDEKPARASSTLLAGMAAPVSSPWFLASGIEAWRRMLGL